MNSRDEYNYIKEFGAKYTYSLSGLGLIMEYVLPGASAFGYQHARYLLEHPPKLTSAKRRRNIHRIYEACLLYEEVGAKNFGKRYRSMQITAYLKETAKDNK